MESDNQIQRVGEHSCKKDRETDIEREQESQMNIGIW